MDSNFKLEDLKIGIIVTIVFLALDIPMFGLINRQMYENQLKKINGTNKIKHSKTLSAAIITYIFLVLGIYFFAVKEKNVYKGALFGLVVYGVYNFTNLATISKYGFYESVIDTIWGVILCSSVTYISIHINDLISLPASVPKVQYDIITTTEIHP